MNSDAKKTVLKAFSHGHISRDEAKKLILSNGDIVLNLSNSGGDDMSDAINKILDRIPAIKAYFKTTIYLGIGIKP
ncbi:hypothetical protein [Cecembia lonarensis]|uniref:Uncharacterized protein n=1 Tax=Cecembia lonarensis (strain CCUG 58316 / KCTC 22772 / LW9) TaxID=1225176 RepID=K1LUK7_CECL9|nr:hypothetical protein [Cecembia lonarensis]EKB47784.1 hypothetical protein B879_03617 [Cecembia lonarensis LW9]